MRCKVSLRQLSQWQESIFCSVHFIKNSLWCIVYHQKVCCLVQFSVGYLPKSHWLSAFLAVNGNKGVTQGFDLPNKTCASDAQNLLIRQIGFGVVLAHTAPCRSWCRLLHKPCRPIPCRTACRLCRPCPNAVLSTCGTKRSIDSFLHLVVAGKSSAFRAFPVLSHQSSQRKC